MDRGLYCDWTYAKSYLNCGGEAIELIAFRSLSV
jgi:hypothetical protein